MREQPTKRGTLLTPQGGINIYALKESPNFIVNFVTPKNGCKSKQQNVKNITRMSVQFYKIALLIIVLVSGVTAKVMPQNNEGYKVKRIIIDPGHGGKDPGGIGTGRYKATESDVVLKVGLQLRDYIREYLPDVEVIMTRDTDVFLKLIERTKIANDAEADLFISLHCNTVNDKRAYGSETFVLGMHKTKDNLEVAKRENKVIFLEENYEENYEGFDPRSPESMIALSMMQSEFLHQSILIAGLVQDQFRERVSRRDRGVKQAGYWVISRTIMPSVLVELGFLTNPKEEDFLNSEQGVTYMASALYRAFRDYKEMMEADAEEADEKISEKIEQTQKRSEDIVEEKTTGTTQSADSAENQKGSDQKEDTAKSNELSAEKVEEQERGREQSALKDAAQKLNSGNAKPRFRVQLASSVEPIPNYREKFKGNIEVEELKLDGTYKYVTKPVLTEEEAVAKQREVRTAGNKDAFVIALFQGKRIPLSRARELLK